ncbi:hypothetical protein KXJ69_02120 [Aureisphaera sp. CAU 1614]|uniref:TonB-dependent receptor n=1 Tax=Halomarinibacterium sedimenti TaxID=2857106 RepID=A0A9X1FNH3_9FLAO|nr:hypothetical protein [Halomarinibacterium sedimenti]MBW2936882.1 hypothetical protein [Halomarinibacterium sedimenti]
MKPLITYIKKIAILSIILTSYGSMAQEEVDLKINSESKVSNTTTLITLQTDSVTNRKPSVQKTVVLSMALKELNFKLDNVIIKNQMLGARNSTLISSIDIDRH